MWWCILRACRCPRHMSLVVGRPLLVVNPGAFIECLDFFCFLGSVVHRYHFHMTSLQCWQNKERQTQTETCNKYGFSLLHLSVRSFSVGSLNTRATLFKSVSKVSRRRGTAECVFQFWRTLVQKSSRHTPPASQRGAGGTATYLKAAARLFRSPPKAYPPTFLLFVHIVGSNLAIIPSLFVSRSLHDDEYFAHEEVRRLHVNFEIKKMIRHFAEPGEGGRARRGFGWPTCQSRRSRPSRMIKYAPLDNKTVQRWPTLPFSCTGAARHARMPSGRPTTLHSCDGVSLPVVAG